MRGWEVRRYALAAVLMAVPMSQLGHLVVYLIAHGPAALGLQSAGPHAYFPPLLKTSLSLAGLLVLIALGAVVVTRRVGSDRHGRAGAAGTWPLLRLIAIMGALQVALFIFQETLEFALSGVQVPPLPELCAWGLAGQLPVALAASLLLKSLSGHLPEVIAGLRSWLLSSVPSGLHARVPAQPWCPALEPRPLTGPGCARANFRRGPPRLL